MTIVVASPADEPFGPLHPHFRYHGFREGGAYWSTIGQHALAARLVQRHDREQVRMNARDPAHAAEMARAMERWPDEDARAREAARVAVRRTFEQSLPLRAVLLATGDAPIDVVVEGDALLGVGADGRGENVLGRALVEARAIARERAADVGAIQCHHPDADDVREACVHALESRDAPRRFHRAFTGRGAAYHVLCEACAAAWPAPPPLRRVCADCFEGLLAGWRVGDVGSPPIRERASSLRFEHEHVALAGLGVDAGGTPAVPGPPSETQPPSAPRDSRLGPRPSRPHAEVIAIAPVARRPSTFLLLDRDGALRSVDLASRTARAVASVDPAALDLSGAPVLVASPDGDFAAIGEAKGRRGVCLDLATGAARPLDRGDYHEDASRWPLAFADVGGRLVLVHATAWNRLDATCPRTGAPLTARTFAERAEGGPPPPHDLDYFHATLHVSPDGERVLDDGWIWHPWGQARVFSLRRWIEDDPFESEDGASVRALAGRAYFWDGPVAWIDATTVAIWGDGDDDANLVPAAILFDAVTGEELRRFHGPARGFAAVGPWLVAFDDERGGAAWDPSTGERLCADPTLAPVSAHPRSGELVAIAGDALRVSRLVG